jgi:hypothetical protein
MRAFGCKYSEQCDTSLFEAYINNSTMTLLPLAVINIIHLANKVVSDPQILYETYARSFASYCRSLIRHKIANNNIKRERNENKSLLEKLTHKKAIFQCRYSLFTIRDFLFVSEKLSFYWLIILSSCTEVGKFCGDCVKKIFKY